VGKDSTIWIEREALSPGGSSWDVFSKEGALIAEARIPGRALSAVFSLRGVRGVFSVPGVGVRMIILEPVA
jgi:hypothetical protein